MPLSLKQQFCGQTFEKLERCHRLQISRSLVYQKVDFTAHFYYGFGIYEICMTREVEALSELILLSFIASISLAS